MDSGMFFPLQVGASIALRLPKKWFNELNTVYRTRKKLVLELVSKLNCIPEKDQTGMFVWAKVPLDTTSELFVDHLLHTYDLFATPGFIFGDQGEGYIRFSLCTTEEKIKEAINRIKI